MSEDALGALIEAAVKLTPDERQRLLREAEELLAGHHTAPVAAVGPTKARDGTPMPCPRCGLVPTSSDIFCGRCGNRIAV